MTYLVAYDGGSGSTAALRRARELADRTGESLLVVSVLPTDESLAAAYGLLEGGEYDPETAADRLEAAARETAPDAAFRTERVGAYAGKRRIADELRRVARETDATLVFVGTDAAGRVVRRLSGAGNPPGDSDYDVFVVRAT